MTWCEKEEKVKHWKCKILSRALVPSGFSVYSLLGEAQNVHGRKSQQQLLHVLRLVWRGMAELPCSLESASIHILQIPGSGTPWESIQIMQL